jgi:hypothetical protein
MSESHVVSGLVAKRSELSSLLGHHQKIIRQLSTALTHIDSSIKLFDPDYDLGTIKTKAPRQGNPWFEHGEAGGMFLDTLRTASTPLSTRQIGEAMVKAKNLQLEGSKDWNLVLKLVFIAWKEKIVFKWLGDLVQVDVAVVQLSGN